MGVGAVNGAADRLGGAEDLLCSVKADVAKERWDDEGKSKVSEEHTGKQSTAEGKDEP